MNNTKLPLRQYYSGMVYSNAPQHDDNQERGRHADTESIKASTGALSTDQKKDLESDKNKLFLIISRNFVECVIFICKLIFGAHFLDTSFFTLIESKKFEGDHGPFALLLAAHKTLSDPACTCYGL